MTAFRYMPIEALTLAVLIGLVAAVGAGLPALRRGETTAAWVTAARVLLGGAVLAVLAVTMMSGAGETGVNLTPSAGIRSALSNLNRDLGLLNLLGNVVMFVPVGLLAPMATRLRLRGVEPPTSTRASTSVDVRASNRRDSLYRSTRSACADERADARACRSACGRSLSLRARLPSVDLAAFHRLATSLPGVRRTSTGGVARWQCHGRLVARELDATHVAVRVPFDVRDALLHQHPGVFSVPSRFTKHMMVVADLAAGDDGAVEDAVNSAWQLQVQSNVDSGGQQGGP